MKHSPDCGEDKPLSAFGPRDGEQEKPLEDFCRNKNELGDVRDDPRVLDQLVDYLARNSASRNDLPHVEFRSRGVDFEASGYVRCGVAT